MQQPVMNIFNDQCNLHNELDYGHDPYCQHGLIDMFLFFLICWLEEWDPWTRQTFHNVGNLSDFFRPKDLS